MTDSWEEGWYENDEGGLFDSSDEAEVEEITRKAEAREQALLNVTETILNDYEGRRWLWEKMKFCHVFGNPVTPNDTHATYFNLGMANVGKMLLAETMKFPKLYMKMAEEAQEREVNSI